MANALGLIRVVSNAELDARDRAAEVAREANMRPSVQGLAKHVLDCWELAKDAKQAVLPRMYKAQRARNGEYEPSKLAAIRETGGSEEYARVTANKCRVVESWLRDVFLGQTDKPWSLKPTPKPDFPPDVEAQVREQVSRELAELVAVSGQMPDPSQVRAALAANMEAVEERLRDAARKATGRMERKIEDQLVQGGFREALSEFLADLVTYPAAIMKGPVLRRRKVLTWKGGEGGGLAPEVVDTIVLEVDRVDPFRAYPAPGAKTPQDGFFIEHLTLTYDDVYELIGAPWYNEAAIRGALHECDNGGLCDWLGFTADKDEATSDAVPRTLRRKVFNIDCLEFHGNIRGRDLLDWGLEEGVDDPDASYPACVWLIGTWVIKAQLNYDPLGQRPYYKACYEPTPGDFWCASVPDVLEDVQGVVNAAVRALANNMAMASGPQVEVNIDRIPPSENVTSITPWKIWQTTDSQTGGNAPALQFFQPNTNVHELLAVIEKFYQFADDFSLVPRFMAGSDRIAGPGRTASGLSMLMDAANKGLKGVVAGVDAVLQQMLEKFYTHNMMYDEDTTIKGDAQVVARGAMSLMQLESLQLRRNEFLQVTANPIDSQIVGIEGRAEILREVARGLELDVSRIVPSREKLAAQQLPAQPPPTGAPPAPQGSGEVLQNGAPVTDNFSPNAMTPQPAGGM